MTAPVRMSAAEYRAMVETPAKANRGNKFGAVRTQVDGIWFDSKSEAERYSALKLLERAKVISGLGCQPVFALMGPKGRPVASYRADFCYFAAGRRVVEDVKSPATLTPQARIKLKLFLQQYPDHELRLVDGKGNAMPYTLRTMKEAA